MNLGSGFMKPSQWDAKQQQKNSAHPCFDIKKKKKKSRSKIRIEKGFYREHRW